MTQANLTVIGYRTGNAEALQTDTDVLGSLDSALVTGLLTLLESDGATYNVSPLGVLKADRLSLLTSLVRIDAVTVTNLVSLFN